MDALENIAIEQLNLGYHADQDRLLLRTGLSNQTEVVVWLSYRVTRMIWQALSAQTSYSVEAGAAPSEPLLQSPSQLVESFKQEVQTQETLNRLDFKTPYVPRRVSGDSGELLVNDAQLLTSEGASPALVMNTLEGVQVRMNLNAEMSVAMLNMLQLACKEAGWPLGASAVSSQLPPLADLTNKQVLH
jgi:hypothetical protein